jgi:hypothetical protein
MVEDLRRSVTNDIDVTLFGGYVVEGDDERLDCFADEAIWKRIVACSACGAPLQIADLLRLDASACRRCFRLAYLQKIEFRFKDYSLFEDISANYAIMLSRPRLGVCDCRLYYYRCGHSTRITQRTDSRLLDAPSRLADCVDVLLRHDAPLEAWGVFLDYQAWVNRWLLSQINESSQGDYASLCIKLYLGIPDHIRSNYDILSEYVKPRNRSFLLLQENADVAALLGQSS